MDRSEKGLLGVNRVGAGPRPQKMGMAKPVRILGAACMVLFFFLAIQMIRSPGTIKGPGDEHKWDDMVRDPNLDGMLHAIISKRRMVV